ncbi:YdcF family protein [Streptomyces sp. NPDC093221]|uniref:YdcF family protein n=1 Tax=Streptomyces sp. NPDC093221 TaxID=3366032 RepID=UPI0038297E32
MHHEPRLCSVAIALGSHDLGVADSAADMYHRSFGPLIVIASATSRTTEAKMPRGEAAHYRDRALELGVPDSAILVEPRARNTGENITFSRELLEVAGVDVTSVLLVSKPYEERRAYATARKIWPSVEFTCASAQRTFDEYMASIQDEHLVIDMTVGALQRFLIYPKQGLMTHQEVPPAVAAAYKHLCSGGFTSRLVPCEAQAN